MTQLKLIVLYVSSLILLAQANLAQAQQDNAPTIAERSFAGKNEVRGQKAKYYEIGLGINGANYRDFATSPLFYRGTALQLSFARSAMSSSRESRYGMSYDFGALSAKSGDNRTASKARRIELSYSQLYRIGLLASEKMHTKVGFLLAGNGNLRTNPALNNNAIGIDVFANLMGSIKITRDVSRQRATEQSKRKRSLDFRLNIGLVNSSFRNGYVYADQSALLNNPDIFGDHQFKIFSGFRASSSLGYTRYLKNKNAVRFSYEWDAYATGGDLDKFEMAHHVLKATLLFNTNNR